MAIQFRKATKNQSKLRLCFVGPSGSGKTYSSLSVASGLGPRVAVLDTEHGSAKKYAGVFAFDVVEIDSFSPDAYVEAIRTAETEGYDVLVIDSLSHAWAGKDGILEFVDQATRSSKSRNAYSEGWSKATPKQNALIDTIVGAKLHVIATLRSKTEYVLEEDRGKKVPRKVGMAPIQRDGVEYEFDVVADLDQDNTAVITKTRCPALTKKNLIEKPGKEFAHLLLGWLSEGAVPVAEGPRLVPPPAPAAPARVDAFANPLLPEINAAWTRAQREGVTRAAWAAKAKAALGVAKPPKDWTAEDLVAVAAALWPDESLPNGTEEEPPADPSSEPVTEDA